MALSACSTSILEGDKIDYKSAAKGLSLEVPPDLTPAVARPRYAAPGGSVSPPCWQAGQAASRRATPTRRQPQLGDAFERDGNQRWLVVNRPADKLWEPVREFWLESGFIFTQDQANLGILETDWAENRAKIPQDVVRAALGKGVRFFVPTGERDKFRTRLERNANGGTDIFISHRGMIEVYTNTQKDQTVWQPPRGRPRAGNRNSLRRLMVKLGVSQEQSKAVASAPHHAPRPPRMAMVNNVPVGAAGRRF